jgi:hypothetical protein
MDVIVLEHYGGDPQKLVWSRVIRRAWPGDELDPTIETNVTTAPTPEAPVSAPIDVASELVAPVAVAENPTGNAGAPEPMNEDSSSLQAQERPADVPGSEPSADRAAADLTVEHDSDRTCTPTPAESVSAPTAAAANHAISEQEELRRIHARITSAIDEHFDHHESSEDEYDDEEEDDGRPWRISPNILDEIDDMAPIDLHQLIENIEAHEEWQVLKNTAREVTQSWLSGLKKAKNSRRCDFVKLDGQRCGSPALKGQKTCYYHGDERARRLEEQAATIFDVSTLDDRFTVQVAITRICKQLADKSIDEKTGRAIISALRLAQRNLAEGKDGLA